MGELLAELFIAVLSGMGLGGGGLLVIYLTLVLGQEQLLAQGANLVFFIATAAVSTLLNLRRGRIVWSKVLPLVLAGIPLSLLGATLAGEISSTLLRRIFGGMLALCGGASLLSMLFGGDQAKKPP